MVKETELVEATVYSPPAGIEKHLRSLLPEAEVVKLIPGDEAKGIPSRIKIIGGNAEEHISTVVDALRKKNAQITSVNISMPTLEDVFIKITGAKLAEGGTT